MKRFGTKDKAKWRVVVCDSKSPRDGRFIEEIGHYDPLPKQEKFVVKADRLEYWIKNGAQMSVALKSLVRRQQKKAKASK
jgi:small subunit ribosomal protein S16